MTIGLTGDGADATTLEDFISEDNRKAAEKTLGHLENLISEARSQAEEYEDGKLSFRDLIDAQPIAYNH